MSYLTARPFLTCPDCGCRHGGAIVPGLPRVSDRCADCCRRERTRAAYTHHRVPRDGWGRLTEDDWRRWGQTLGRRGVAEQLIVLLAPLVGVLCAALFVALMLSRPGGW